MAQHHSTTGIDSTRSYSHERRQRRATQLLRHVVVGVRDHHFDMAAPQAQAAAAVEEEKEGKMSETQARALLRAMENEEDKVDLLERQVFEDVSKDW